MKRLSVRTDIAVVSAAVILFLSFCITGCGRNTMDLRKPMYTITEPECREGNVYFDFYNRAKSAVTVMEMRMNIYDKKDGKPVSQAQGTIVSESRIKIAAGEKRNICIPLNNYLAVAKGQGFIIDQFYISRINYENGKVWKDEFGIYAVSGKEAQ